MKNKRQQCVDFIKKNGWERQETDGGYFKAGYISVYFDEKEIVFVDDTGDFCHKPIDLMTLIGVLVYNRQLCMSFKQ